MWAINGIVNSSSIGYFVTLVRKIKKVNGYIVIVLQRQHMTTVNTPIENKLVWEKAQKARNFETKLYLDYTLLFNNFFGLTLICDNK